MVLDPGNLPGDTASLDFGQKTAMDRERKALEQAGSPGQGQAPPQGGAPAPNAPGAPSPGGPPAQPPPGLFQPSVPPMASRPIDQGIQMGNVFQKPPELQEPWRTWLRRQGRRQGAGPELRALADSIDFQRGPLDKER